MPTLDDLPTLATVSSLTSDDLFPIYDLTATGSSKVRKVPIATMSGLNFGVQTETVAGSTAFAITAAAQLVRFNGTLSGASGIVTVTLPNPAGAIRDVILSGTFTSGSGTPTLTITSPVANTLFTFASASGVTSVTGYSAANTVRLLSDGTNWYRTH
jgi:hypothetical protein